MQAFTATALALTTSIAIIILIFPEVASVLFFEAVTKAGLSRSHFGPAALHLRFKCVGFQTMILS